MNLSSRALSVVGSVVRWWAWKAALLTPTLALSFAWADEPVKSTPTDPLREVYRGDAENCSFSIADGKPLRLANESIMRWSTDDDWSGDVFVWMQEKRPEVIGCIMSGPTDGSLRRVVHEFHLLAEMPIAPAVVQGGRRWKPTQGLKRERLADAPPPASSAAARLVQMRQIARSFTVSMENDGRWELRLLPQPLLRYGDDNGEVTDGALFCYVWPKGTDPEFVLLVECGRDDRELAWQFAPVRFTTRELWLRRGDREEWHAEPYPGPTDGLSSLYTVDSGRFIPKLATPAAEQQESK